MEFSLTALEEGLLNQYIQTGVSLGHHLVLKFLARDLPANRSQVIHALRESFPGVDLRCLSATTCSTIWVLHVESPERKQELLDAGTLKVGEKFVALLDFKASNSIEITVTRIADIVGDNAIQIALSKYGKIIQYKVGVDPDGVPSADRWVKIEGHKNVKRHEIPDTLRIGSVKGFMRVRGNEPTCTLCHKRGHMRRACPTPRCSKCNRFGHLADTCKGRAFADLFKEKEVTPLSDLNEEELKTYEEIQQEGLGKATAKPQPSAGSRKTKSKEPVAPVKEPAAPTKKPAKKSVAPQEPVTPDLESRESFPEILTSGSTQVTVKKTNDLTSETSVSAATADNLSVVSEATASVATNDKPLDQPIEAGQDNIVDPAEASADPETTRLMEEVSFSPSDASSVGVTPCYSNDWVSTNNFAPSYSDFYESDASSNFDSAPENVQPMDISNSDRVTGKRRTAHKPRPVGSKKIRNERHKNKPNRTC